MSYHQAASWTDGYTQLKMENLQNLQVNIDNATGVALIQLDRPAKRNAFSQAMMDEIVLVLTLLDSLDSVRAVVMTGSPDGPFCGALDSTQP